MKSLRGSTLLLTCFFSMVVLAGCAGGGSGGSGGGQQTNNPEPQILSFSPSSAVAGGPAFTLTINGENFMSASQVYWNGSLQTASFVSASEFQIQIPAADIANIGTATLNVVNPGPGGGNSGFAEFSINPASNPSPTLSLLTPSTVSAGSPGFLLTVGGSNFVPGSTIEWNGSQLQTTYLNDSQLQVQTPASSIASPGFVAVTVSTPGPGGGDSAAL